MRILECHDGDTCKARSPLGFELTLRLLGVDTPELARKSSVGHRGWQDQIYGLEAARFTQSELSQKQVNIEFYGSDAYSRYLVLIYPSNSTSSFNERLVTEGFGFAYRGKMQETDLQKKFIHLEEQARLNKRGFWSLNQKPLEPGLHRHQN